MPRDATGTRERILRSAERLMAGRGVHQATSRDILEAAGQRNASALTYHFGSRDRLLLAILERHNGPLEEQRLARFVEPVEAMATRDLVAALVVPYAGCLAAPEGRDYLRIVAQLTDMFPGWRTPPVHAPILNRALAVLESRASGPPAVRRHRVVAMMMLMTAACAERARLAEEGAPAELGVGEFVADLVDMIVAVLEAPVGAPLAAPAPAAHTS